MKHRLFTVLIISLVILSGCSQSPAATPMLPAATEPVPAKTAEVPSIANAVAKVSPSVVQIITDEGSGSGIVIDTTGHVLTNNHVVEKASSATIVFKDGRKVDAKIASRDWFLDLAILEIANGNFVAATLGDSNKTRLGEEVVALGFPSGLGGSVTITRGIISAFRNPYLQTDAAVNPGSSGGPLVNMYGEIIGIVTFKPRLDEGEPAEGIGFAIAINEVKQSLSNLINLSSQGAGSLAIPPLIEEIPGDYGLLSTDSVSNVHYVYSEPAKAGVKPTLKYSVKQAGARWTTPEMIAEGSKPWGGAVASQVLVNNLVVDQSDTVHLIWCKEDSTQRHAYDLFHSSKPSGKGWSVPVNISKGRPFNFSSLAVDSKDTLHLVRLEANIMGFTRTPGIEYIHKPNQGEWSEPVTIPNTDKVPGNTVLNLKFDNHDNLYLTYYLENNIYLSQKVGNSPWTSPERISNPSEQSVFPDIVIDHNNALHLIWMERPGRIVYRSRGANGAWSPQGYVSGIDHICNTWKLAVGANGTVYAAWTQQPNVEDKEASLFVRWKTSDGSWSPPYFLYEGHGRFLWLKSFAIDGNDIIHMLVADEMKPGEHVSRYITVVPVWK